MQQAVEAKDTCLQGRQPLLQPVQVLLQVVSAVYQPCAEARVSEDARLLSHPWLACA